MDKNDAVIHLAKTLICEDNIQLFLKELCNYYIGDSAHIIEIKESHRQCYTYSKVDTDVQKLTDDVIKGNIDRTKMVVHPLHKRDELIGYVVVQNNKFSDTNYVVQAIADFIVKYLSNLARIQNLIKSANIDDLTRLKNRNEYIRKFNEIKESIPSKLGVMFIDINSLKEMNDMHGHEYGDSIIRSTASIILGFVGDCGYRFGGDEFIVLMPDIDKDSFYSIVDKLTYEMNNVKTHSVSIGVCYRDCDVDIEYQVRTADALMYAAKERHYKERVNNRRGQKRDITKDIS